MKKKPQTGGQGLIMHICPVCKKQYLPAPEHAYKVGKSLTVCSYTCMRKEERRRGWVK